MRFQGAQRLVVILRDIAVYRQADVGEFGHQPFCFRFSHLKAVQFDGFPVFLVTKARNQLCHDLWIPASLLADLGQKVRIIRIDPENILREILLGYFFDSEFKRGQSGNGAILVQSTGAYGNSPACVRTTFPCLLFIRTGRIFPGLLCSRTGRSSPGFLFRGT